MRQISRRMEMIHPTIGWRRDEHGTQKHAHDSWILWSVSRVRSKTMHSLSCITSWLPYITLCYIVSRFFLPLEQPRTALLGCRLASSQGCLSAVMGKLLQLLSAYQQARRPLCKLWGEHRFSVPDLVSSPARFTLYARKLYRIKLLFTHKSGDFAAISVKEQSCAAPIS